MCQKKKEEHVNKDSRKDYRSGYRKRSLNTSLGKIDLSIPRLRKEGFIPCFLRRSKRSDIALESMICEIYTNGLSTRKIERFANKLGLGKLQKLQRQKFKKGFKRGKWLRLFAFWLKSSLNWPIFSKISQCMAYIFEIYAKNISNLYYDFSLNWVCWSFP